MAHPIVSSWSLWVNQTAFDKEWHENDAKTHRHIPEHFSQGGDQ